MNDRERAAELAGKIEEMLPLGPFNRATLNDEHAGLVVTALRAYATRPEPPQDLREVVEQAIRWFGRRRNSAPDEEIAARVLGAICANHAIVPREPSKAAVVRALSTASERAYSDETGLHRTFEVPTHASMRAALIEYGEKGNG